MTEWRVNKCIYYVISVIFYVLNLQIKLKELHSKFTFLVL